MAKVDYDSLLLGWDKAQRDAAWPGKKGARGRARALCYDWLLKAEALRKARGQAVQARQELDSFLQAKALRITRLCKPLTGRGPEITHTLNATPVAKKGRPLLIMVEVGDPIRGRVVDRLFFPADWLGMDDSDVQRAMVEELFRCKARSPVREEPVYAREVSPVYITEEGDHMTLWASPGNPKTNESIRVGDTLYRVLSQETLGSLSYYRLRAER